MTRNQDAVEDARSHIARAEAARQAELDRRVAEASAPAMRAAELREAEARLVDLRREQERQRLAKQRADEERELFRTRYIDAGGDPALFDEAYKRHQLEEAERRMRDFQYLARESVRRAF